MWSGLVQQTTRIKLGLHVGPPVAKPLPREVQPEQAEPKVPKSRKRTRRKPKQHADAGDESEGESYNNDNFSGDDETSDSEAEDIITGEELANALPSKTDPKSQGKRKAPAPPKKKRKKVTATEQSEAYTSQTAIPTAKTKKRAPPKWPSNPFWLFFSETTVEKPVPGSKYYKCHLGEETVIKLKAASNGNLSKSHLNKHLTQRMHYYLHTSYEVDIANGTISMTVEIARKYKQKVKNIKGNIVNAFKKQTEESWDQNCFEELLAFVYYRRSIYIFEQTIMGIGMQEY
ncbi:hypothetical protein BT96DRAFT_950533 [Gymnopus androsaceus JB14]|uniref:Uncharacterized protein n=1 Tax=Gymnopus androsaceus JB14 TaxID=1447944 RepID=A0A6A4GGS3_9AGAR|nr:hypothetical protein BT96DRAFT_950533 [Gymnopus androsaceus JB14]